MAYLIAHLAPFLFLTTLFALAGGWAWHALKTADDEEAIERERARLLGDVRALLSGDAALMPAGVSPELDREMDMLRRRADIAASRITELEAALETARMRAEEAVGRSAELERDLEAADLESNDDAMALRARLAELEERESAPAQVAAVLDEEAAAQAWRLRYFEQRVRYLEDQARSAPAEAPAAVEEPQQGAAEPEPSDESELLRLSWRTRYAEARARAMEQAVREAEAAPAPLVSAHASPPAEDDAMLRDRLRYLEKRVAHLQAEPEVGAAPAADEAEAIERERLQWRARYLEARVRHLDAALERAQAAPVAAPEPAPAPTPETSAPMEEDEEEEVFDEDFAIDEDDDIAEPVSAPLVPAGAEQRPEPLAGARGGAPDDLTLIEGVSLLQQSTLNSLGIYHFEQIAAWSPANIAWVDQYLRLRGRISREEWVDQARAIVRGGPAAARRMHEDAL